MTDLMLTRSRAATSPHVLRRGGDTARHPDARAAGARGVAARHRHCSSSERGSDRLGRSALPVYGWRDVEAAWLVMVVLVAALATWMSLPI